MAAEGTLSEALIRIEYKVDLVLDYIGRTAPVLLAQVIQENRLGDSKQTCPACGNQVATQVDIVNKVITRKCGCSSGKSAPIDLGVFAPPVLPAKRESADGSDQEDRNNSRDRGGYRRG